MKDDMTTRVGETSVLECMASGSPRPKLQWLKDSQALEVTPRHFFTADNQLLIIVETKWEDQGTYTCEMSNTLGIMRGNTKLRVMSRNGEVCTHLSCLVGIEDLFRKVEPHKSVPITLI